MGQSGRPRSRPLLVDVKEHVFYDESAEQAVLGAVLGNSGALVAAQEHLSVDDFYLRRHQTIFKTMVNLFSEGREIDVITVGSVLTKEKDYLHFLAENCPSVVNVVEYARIVKDQAQRRKLVRAGHEIVELAKDTKTDIATLVDQAEEKVYSIDPSRAHNPEQAKDVLARLLESIEEDTPSDYIPTGFPALDELINGFRPRCLYVIGARPAKGKSALGMALAANAATHGRVLFYSLEMSRDELVERLACSRASVKLRSVREHNLHPEEHARLVRAMGEIEKMDLKIDDEPGQTLVSIRAASRRERTKSKLALIVIDYLQLMTSGKHSDSEYAELSAMSRDLKLLAGTLDCPILVLSQLNRESESQWSDGKPRLHHLRGSGSIEQDADVVLLLSWPKDKQGYVLVDVGKNRHGPLGEVLLRWSPEYTRFSDDGVTR